MSERQTVLKWTRTSFLCFPFAAEFLSSLSSNALSDLWSDIMEEFLICADPQHGGSGGREEEEEEEEGMPRSALRLR